MEEKQDEVFKTLFGLLSSKQPFEVEQNMIGQLSRNLGKMSQILNFCIYILFWLSVYNNKKMYR